MPDTDRMIDGLPPADHERIYSRRIRPDLLDGVEPSPSATAVLVGGPPGLGTAYASALIRAHLARSVGASVLVSADALRVYHPDSIQPIGASAPAHPAEVGTWFTQLIGDAIARRVSLIVASSLRVPAAALALTERLRQAQYEVSAVVLACDADLSRQLAVARYDLARPLSAPAPFVSAHRHDRAYPMLRESLARLEAESAVHRLQIVTVHGRQLYANERGDAGWLQEPKAVKVVDDYRERRRTARELADSALRWQTLAQRFGNDSTVPREIASQVIRWSTAAAALADSDVEARRLLAWGREAEALERLPRHQFLREFPQHEKTVQRLEEAVKYAETHFEQTIDRERFVAKTRQRLAERIAEGRAPAPDRPKAPERDAGTR